MNIQLKLVILILVLTLDDQVHSGEVIGGHVAVPHSRPYMVLMEMEHNNKIKYCGGFLLNEDFVMTAAHCQADSYTLLLGVHHYDESNDIQKLFVEKAFPHEDYNTEGYKNDIMLLKMKSKANFSKIVKPIDIADQGYDLLPQHCAVSGWGRTVRNRREMSLILMEANVTLIGSEQCQNKEHSYCSKGDTGPSVGDSGGPLVCEDGKAYGVVSSTFKPDNGGPLIDYYAKIPDFRQWIDSIMKKYQKVRLTK
ncbi:granzyme B(G,H)-like [Scomber scombrus]|uniref:granzyme B(G,H)-like n=1 Tax=Scomber scombrus TaxID=13677 RepID=UPI002DDC5583|nr:granzyme B(G,H)-like [Scomber scombrus]